MCHVCICKKKRASRSSSFSAAARRSSPRRKTLRKKRTLRKRKTDRPDRLFVSRQSSNGISGDSRVGQPAEQSVTVCKFDRAPYRVGKRRSFGCVDLRLRDGRWTAARLDAGRARRLDPDRGSARPWRIRARRAPTRRRRDSALSSNAVPSGAPTGDPVFSVGHLVIAFWGNSRAKRRGFLRKKRAKRRCACAFSHAKIRRFEKSR
jgi:hypothetical protein